MFGRRRSARTLAAQAVRRQADRATRRTSARAGAGSSAATLGRVPVAAAARRGALRARARRRAPPRCARRLPERVSRASSSVGWGVPPSGSRAAEPDAAAAGAARARRAPRSADGPTLAFAGRLTAPEGARGRARGGGAKCRRCDCSSSRATGDERAALERRAQSSGSTTASASSARCRASGCSSSFRARRRVAPLLGVGELPAHGGRGARRRDAGASRPTSAASREVVTTARTACSSRPATRGARRRDPPLLRRRRAARAAARAARRPSAERFSPERIFGQLEEILIRAARMTKPRVLIVGRTRYRLPLDGGLARKFDALASELDVRVLGERAARARRRGDGTFRSCRRAGRSTARAFWRALPFRVRARAARVPARRRRRPEPVRGGGRARRRAARVPRDPRGARRLADRDAALRLAARRAARAARRPRRARGRCAAPTPCGRSRRTRPASSARLGVEPAADVPRVHGPRSVPRPTVAAAGSSRAALFVGVLERYKDVDGLAAAWRLAAPRLPGATLRIVGTGSRARVVEGLVRDLPAQIEWTPTVPTDEIAGALDASTVLVLPSRSEGLGRVVVEAFCRGRPVVATRVGGIPDLVARRRQRAPRPGRRPGRRSPTRSCACSRTARSPSGSAAGGQAVAPSSWLATPEEYARRMRELVEQVAAVKPRVLFVGPTRYELPLSPGLARKWEAIGDVLDYRVLARGQGQRPALPARLRASTPGCRSACGALAARVPARRDRRRGSADAPLSSSRRPDRRAGDRRGARRLAPLDAALRLLGAARRCRPSSTASTSTASATPTPCARSRGYTAGLVEDGARPPAGRGLPHLHRPLGVHRPPRSSRCPSGRPRSSSACSSATRTSTGSSRRGASSRSALPEARLVVVGKGSRRAVVESLVADGLAERLRRSSRPSEVAAQLDDATRPRPARRAPRAWPRRDRGLRARPRRRRDAAPAASPTSSTTARRACSSTPRTSAALADALVRVLSDRELAERLGAAARAALPRVAPDARSSSPSAAGARRTRSYTRRACVRRSSSSC